MAENADDTRLLFAILQYLEQLKVKLSKSDASLDVVEPIEVAQQCLSETFQIDISDEKQTQKYDAGCSLLDIFSKHNASLNREDPKLNEKVSSELQAQIEQLPLFKKYMVAIQKRNFFGKSMPGSSEYDKLYTRAVDKFLQRFPDAISQSSAAKVDNDSSLNDANILAADAFKAEGNTAMTSKDYVLAESLYTKAIEKNSDDTTKSYIYFGNRAAARLHLKRYEDAEDDCRRALALRPDYAKVHSRLGTALVSLGKLEEASRSFERALELDPQNSTARSNLEDTQRRIQLSQSAANVGHSTRDSAGTGMPDLGSLMGMMQNPAMMQAAQGMMQNPAMMEAAKNMMQNPAMMQSMMGMLGGANNGPNMAQMASMMQGLQGGAASDMSNTTPSDNKFVTSNADSPK